MVSATEAWRSAHCGDIRLKPAGRPKSAPAPSTRDGGVADGEDGEEAVAATGGEDGEETGFWGQRPTQSDSDFGELLCEKREVFHLVLLFYILYVLPFS